MIALFNVAFPVFALIGIGYGCRRVGVLGPQASREISRFVIYLALPAMLFHGTTRVSPADLGNLGFIAAYAVGAAVTFIAAMVIARRRGARPVDDTIEALGASYPNAGFMGLPICVLAFGDEGLLPGLIATLMTACVIFAATIVIIEGQVHAGGGRLRSLARVGASLLRNPIVIAPVLGATVAASGVALPSGIGQLVGLLAATAGPCALVSLGLFLAEPVPAVRGSGQAVAGTVLMKLLLQPAVTAVMVLWVVPQTPVWAACAIIMAALPIGTGPFMLAELYKRDATASSRAILLSTVGSLLTIPALLVWLA